MAAPAAPYRHKRHERPVRGFLSAPMDRPTRRCRPRMEETPMSRLLAAALLAGVSSLALAQDAPENSQLSLPIMSKDEKPAGLLEMTDTPNGVLIVVTFAPGG